ncbi:hypothetical protein SLA2020_284270 [Shorea laevis]
MVWHCHLPFYNQRRLSVWYGGGCGLLPPQESHPNWRLVSPMVGRALALGLNMILHKGVHRGCGALAHRLRISRHAKLGWCANHIVKSNKVGKVGRPSVGPPLPP